jgi:hypothetical protein
VAAILRVICSFNSTFCTCERVQDHVEYISVVSRELGVIVVVVLYELLVQLELGK